MRWDYPPLDINPAFLGPGEVIVIIVVAVVVVIIIIIITIIIIIIIILNEKLFVFVSIWLFYNVKSVPHMIVLVTKIKNFTGNAIDLRELF